MVICITGGCVYQLGRAGGRVVAAGSAAVGHGGWAGWTGLGWAGLGWLGWVTSDQGRATLAHWGPCHRATNTPQLQRHTTSQQ